MTPLLVTRTLQAMNRVVAAIEGGFWPLPDAKHRDRRLNGLGFTCDEKYTSEHMCQNKHFRLLVLKGDEEDAEEGLGPSEEEREEEG